MNILLNSMYYNISKALKEKQCYDHCPNCCDDKNIELGWLIGWLQCMNCMYSWEVEVRDDLDF